jgi:CelD/BcsL family acetyltransferase involved in cellulose biosynthesis
MVSPIHSATNGTAAGRRASLRVEILRTEAALQALVPEWRSLLERAPEATLAQTPVWNMAWLRHYGAERTLTALAFRSAEGELVGLAPLVKRVVYEHGALPIRRLSLFCADEDEHDEVMSDYVGMLAARGHEDEVAEAFVAELEAIDRISGVDLGWDEFVYGENRRDEPTMRAVARALEARGLDAHMTEVGESRFIELPSTWDAYLKSLPGSSRYAVTRALRDLERAVGKDGYRLRIAPAEAPLAEGQKVLRELHGERWRERALFAQKRFDAFHADVMRAFAARQDATLELIWLEAAGRPIASLYNIVHDGRVYFYQAGRVLDPPGGVRPGIAIHALAIRHAIEAGYREYDFLKGSQQYKRQLAVTARPLVVCRAVAKTPRAFVVEGARRGITRLRAEASRLRERYFARARAGTKSTQD